MVAGSATTVFVNKTGHVVRMKVGNNQHFSYLASIKDGGEYKMHVNVNDTYREFAVCLDESSKKEIVSSDDCCEFQCITIQEMADGKIELLRQPRESISGSRSVSKKSSWFSLWT